MQEIADMKFEKTDLKLEINMLTYGLQHFASSDVDIRFDTGFPSHSTLTSHFLPLN